jgi:hypothetical protein
MHTYYVVLCMSVARPERFRPGNQSSLEPRKSPSEDAVLKRFIGQRIEQRRRRSNYSCVLKRLAIREVGGASQPPPTGAGEARLLWGAGGAGGAWGVLGVLDGTGQLCTRGAGYLNDWRETNIPRPAGHLVNQPQPQ